MPLEVTRRAQTGLTQSDAIRTGGPRSFPSCLVSQDCKDHSSERGMCPKCSENALTLSLLQVCELPEHVPLGICWDRWSPPQPGPQTVKAGNKVRNHVVQTPKGPSPHCHPGHWDPEPSSPAQGLFKSHLWLVNTNRVTSCPCLPRTPWC